MPAVSYAPFIIIVGPISLFRQCLVVQWMAMSATCTSLQSGLGRAVFFRPTDRQIYIAGGEVVEDLVVISSRQSFTLHKTL